MKDTQVIIWMESVKYGTVGVPNLHIVHSTYTTWAGGAYLLCAPNHEETFKRKRWDSTSNRLAVDGWKDYGKFVFSLILFQTSPFL